MIIELRAKLLTQEGRPKKLLIPPHTIKFCPISADYQVYIQEMRFEGYISENLAKRSLFFIQTGPLDNWPKLTPLIHNGSWESQWIEHEELVVNIYEFRA